MTAITVRPITDAGGLRAVELLQRDVWGMPDLEVVPSHQLVAAVAAGGAVLGAFDEEGTLLGFCYGFVGLRDGRLLFYSHMAGVRPDYQDRDIGFLLKRAQRQVALDAGLDHMVWTYDPLQAANASFNLRKLGAIAARYYVDYYGEMPDAINRGMPSDRLEVDWSLRDPAVAARVAGAFPARAWPDVPAALAPYQPASSSGAPREASAPVGTGLAGAAQRGTVMPQTPVLELDAPVVRIEIPRALGDLKTSEPDAVLAWRSASREAFLHYFGRGYRAVDFVTRRDASIGAYVLQRKGMP